jgi:hypothetical protein
MRMNEEGVTGKGSGRKAEDGAACIRKKGGKTAVRKGKFRNIP